MVSADIISAAAQQNQSISTSTSTPTPTFKSTLSSSQYQLRSQPHSHSQQPYSSRTKPQPSRTWNPIPRYFTTSSTDTSLLSSNGRITTTAAAAHTPTSTLTATTTDTDTDTDTNNSSLPSDFLPSTSLTNRFKNFYRMATNTMSPAGQTAYWSDADTRYSAIDCTRCETQRDYLLRYSPIIRYLSSNISTLGGTLDSSNIRCRTCTTSQLGGFDKNYGIMLCANYIDKQSMLEDVLAHEMVHAYDHLRFKTDLGPDEDLRKVACAEIRASNLSGECRWANEFFRNKVLSFTSHHQDCVRRRAVISVKMRPNCKSDLEAVKAVNEVWEGCFRDTRPFDEIFR